MTKQTFDILAVNETRLDNTISDSLIHLPNPSGGGECSYIRNCINYRRLWDLENESLELLALEINKPNSKPFLVLCWYRPPHSPVEHFDVSESLLKPG